MKKLSLLISFSFVILSQSQSQERDENMVLLYKLDSISKSPSVSRYFASIYLETTLTAMQFFSNADTLIQRLMNKMQLEFAEYFFRSAIAFNSGQTPPIEWRAYYADSGAAPLRYLCYGINAHINGDIWQAIAKGFTPDEVKILKPHYFKFQKGLLEIYSKVYKQAIESHRRIRIIHVVSLGLDKLYGKALLKRWRKRQFTLAELYYSNPAEFERRLHKVQHKMTYLNTLIRKNI